MAIVDLNTHPQYGTDGSNQFDRDVLVRTAVYDAASSFADQQVLPGEGHRRANWGEITYKGCYKEAIGLVGNATIVALNAIVTPTIDDAYVIVTAGTPVAGLSDALVIGDVAEWDGIQWKKVISAVGGFVPATTAYQLTGGTDLIAPYANDIDEGKVVVFNGISNTGTLGSLLVTPDSPPYVPCRDQADADAKGCLSMWDIALLKRDSITPHTYDLTGGSFRVDSVLRGTGNIAPPLSEADEEAHMVFAVLAPDIPAAYGGRQTFYDGYLYPNIGAWVEATGVQQAKSVPAGIPVRLYVYYPKGAKQRHVARFVHRRHLEI